MDELALQASEWNFLQFLNGVTQSTNPTQADKRRTIECQLHSRWFLWRRHESLERDVMQTTTAQKLFFISAFLAIFFVICARTSVEAMSTQRLGVSAFRAPCATMQPISAISAVPRTFAIASWYGKKFQGRRTSSGERFDLHKLTAAHKSLPLGSLVKLTSKTTGRSVVVRINDRGPWLKGRDFDLSEAAATKLGMHEQGVAAVEMALVK